METSLKNREDQLKQLMERLKDHVSSCVDVRIYKWLLRMRILGEIIGRKQYS